VELRERLYDHVKGDQGNRDLLLLDVSLEDMYRRGFEGADLRQIGGDDLLGMMGLSLRSAALSMESDALWDICHAWGSVLEAGDKWTPEWSKRALAVAERAALCLSDIADETVAITQQHCEAFAEECSTVKEEYVLNFGEEVVRGIAGLFVPLRVMGAIEPMLRETAGMGPWEVLSQGVTGAAAGELLVVKSLGEPKAIAELGPGKAPRVVVVEEMTGAEDIPPAAVAVITARPVDLLSHIAIRARGQGVLLAHCADPGTLAQISALSGVVAASVAEDGSVAVGPSSAPAGSAGFGLPFGKASPSALELAKPEMTERWCVGPDAFGSGVVGAKSANVGALGATVPADVMQGLGMRTLPACAVPFGSFERVLMDEGLNAGPRAAFEAALADAGGWGDRPGAPSEALERVRAAVCELGCPEALRQEVAQVARASGVTASDLAADAVAWEETWEAIRLVWASQWGERAWLARRTCGVPEGQLRMACLLQPVADTKYAFVLHSRDPQNPESGDVAGEVVRGLGEVLVGNYPGRALRFAGRADGSVECRALMSKGVCVWPPAGGGIIARSDSNGEDLEEYSGAGLYDSVVVGGANNVGYPPMCDEPLVWDPQARDALLARLAAVARAVEGACGGAPQDIEGCVAEDGTITIVQTRAQA